jgi:pimeloyl-ACP methyl ester carboxylesterase
MMPAETNIIRQRLGGLPGRLLPLLLAGAVSLVLTAVASARGDGLVIHSGGAELRSATPREAGKVPVVFVHGMLGSPGNWSLLIDRLSTDPWLRERFQFLTLGYDSLQPIPDSGRELLDALAEARRRSDPGGRDGSFDRVVLVGHSLGGLVAEDAAARSHGYQPRGAIGPPTGGPTGPRVGRLVFLATPHRGAPVDDGAVRAVGIRLARALSPSIAARQARGDASALISPTSVDHLAWDHPILRDLERGRAAAGIPYHSIIAALGVPTAEGATDGLVPVASARLVGARSEVVVRTHHICFQHPEVIREVRRVLGEHTAEFDRPPGLRPGGSPPVGSLGAISVPPAPQEAQLVTLGRPAALPRGGSPADSIRLTRPRDVPEEGTP